ncbi:hypothetical protein HCR_17050 [Hydrogenimonas cancrithermarum]|uniref:Uncharacterized protein n=1 Tax=Hydrogenimonas cancrithermarum TaxID=2993563 RepID=A0ABM8FLZ4_9BACT|nr:hypothetical protein HCR_17050 [Hydrogenimonas cancrithermarum]
MIEEGGKERQKSLSCDGQCALIAKMQISAMTSSSRHMIAPFGVIGGTVKKKPAGSDPTG